jgi:hypothetical protein
MNSLQTRRSGLHTHFIIRLHLRLAFSHSITQHSTSTPLPEPERQGFTPKRQLLGCFLRVDLTPFLPPWILPEFEPRFLPVWWTGLLGWFPSLSRFLCATRIHLLGSPGDRLTPLDQHGLVVLGMGNPPSGLGTLNWWQRKHHTPKSGWPPRNVAGGLRWHWEGTKAFGKQVH